MFGATLVKKSEVSALVAATFPEYRGRKFKVQAATKVALHDLNWSGGTRSVYRSCTIDGQLLGTSARANATAPWVNKSEGQEIDLPQGAVLVRHAQFCGTDAGLTIFIHPADLPKYLPTPASPAC